MAKKDNELVIRKESLPDVQRDIIDEIRNLHTEIQGHIKMTVEKAVRLGELLTNVKEMLPYGEFGRFIKENCGFTDRTARNYMKVFEHVNEVKTETVSDLSTLYRLIASPKDTQSDDSDVVQIIEADDTKELRELQDQIESLEKVVKNVNKAVSDKDREIAKLKEIIDKNEYLDKQPVEMMQAYKKIADAGGDCEVDCKETAFLMKQIDLSRKYFRDHALVMEASYVPDISKGTLRDEVVALLKIVGRWTNTIASKFEVTQEDL